MKYCLWLLLMGSSVYAQPKNMKEAMVYLDRECADSLKTVIKEGIPVDLRDIKIADWLDNRKSKLNRYLLHKGIHTEQKVIIITAYKDHLLGKPLDEDVLYTPWLKLEEKHHRDTAAYLKGTYIPKDLNDAIVQIDKMWDDKTKQQNKKIAENEFTARMHHGFGMWMRNNWGLWGGSRLSIYFNNMGVYHPDDISGIILTSYYRHLNNSDYKLDEQIKFYQDYWKNEEAKARERQQKKPE